MSKFLCIIVSTITQKSILTFRELLWAPEASLILYQFNIFFPVVIMNWFKLLYFYILNLEEYLGIKC